MDDPEESALSAEALEMMACPHFGLLAVPRLISDHPPPCAMGHAGRLPMRAMAPLHAGEYG